MDFLKQFLRFIYLRKKFWLAPLMLAILILGTIIVISEGSVISPFVYTLF